MFGSRKSALVIALTVITLLAMLVPAVSAAPEWVAGINITAPTAAKPAYVDPANPALKSFTISYDLTITGTQVDDVWVRYRAIDMNNSVVVWEWHKIWPGVSIKTGVNSLTSDPIEPLWDPGWYRVEACVMDGDWFRPLFCDHEDNALLIDLDNPGARLIKPEQGAAVTGQAYLLVGKAWDPWWAENDQLMRYGAIKETWFEYCVITNWQGDWCGPKDQSWVKIADGAATPGVPDQYQANWDSSQVPDDLGVIKFCAKDLVGRKACDVATVTVNNRAVVHLEPGWNLISVPLMLYKTAIGDVLGGVSPAGAVTMVAAYDAATGTWTKWNADPNTPSNLTDIKDGYGYWVYSKTEAWVTVVGTWKNVGPEVPPEYAVFESWNLIGYTHWGQPTWLPNKTVVEYLSTNSPAVKAMWRYDAGAEIYVQTVLPEPMMQGAGYWLALAQAGSINP